jgi:fructose 5-dehydrogenase small subunit
MSIWGEAGVTRTPASKRRTEMSNGPTHWHIHEALAQIRRRRLLVLLLASPVLPVSWRGSMAQGATGEGTAAAVGEKFMTLSIFATGRSKLDPEIGAALLAALRESDATFAAAVDDLAADAASGKYSDVEGLEAAVRGTPKHAALLALVSAWYTGSVSSNGKERFITLQEALLYQPIADGSHIPGNCAGAPNSWADLPAPAVAAMPTDR